MAQRSRPCSYGAIAIVAVGKHGSCIEKTLQSLFLRFCVLTRVSFRIFVKGGGCDNFRVKGGQRLHYFPSVKNDVVLINLIILEGLGVCSPRKFF